MNAKQARQIRLGIKTARADIKRWGDNDGSKLLLLVLVATVETRIQKYPILFQRGYLGTTEKFFKRGGNIEKDKQ